MHLTPQTFPQARLTSRPFSHARTPRTLSWLPDSPPQACALPACEAGLGTSSPLLRTELPTPWSAPWSSSGTSQAAGRVHGDPVHGEDSRENSSCLLGLRKGWRAWHLPPLHEEALAVWDQVLNAPAVSAGQCAASPRAAQGFPEVSAPSQALRPPNCPLMPPCVLPQLMALSWARHAPSGLRSLPSWLRLPHLPREHRWSVPAV